VVAAKVKTHSLLAINFKSGQLRPGRRGPRGANGLTGAAGPAATRLFATVKQLADGVELGPSSGVVTPLLPKPHDESGRYKLTFNKDVSNCAVLATLGGKDLKAGEAAAQTTGGTGGGEVTVQTFDETGHPADHDFTVALFC
jgi:hypothetical protein